jgi:general secretion pathway protein G
MGYAVDPWDQSRLCQPPHSIARKPAFCEQAADRGFTLIELLITIAIILTICAIAIPNLLAALDLAKMAKAVGDIRAIGVDIQAYNLSNGQYPATLADINRDTFPDPWGNPYQYLNFADTKGKGAMRKDRFLVPINSYFDLYSIGKDGQSVPPLTAKVSQDDIIWANDGDYIGLASQY